MDGTGTRDFQRHLQQGVGNSASPVQLVDERLIHSPYQLIDFN
jgi:hypothetical protein